MVCSDMTAYRRTLVRTRMCLRAVLTIKPLVSQTFPSGVECARCSRRLKSVAENIYRTMGENEETPRFHHAKSEV